MDKRYQVFVSSTYIDLKDERSKVMQALMEMDCIPAGMELFPAADEDQWRFIEKVIDDCDYYLLIIGGRYGSVTSEGISFTEKEYDYAVAKGLRVIALIHGAPDSLPVSRSELAPDRLEKLVAFRTKVSSGRLVRFWQSGTELPGLVALSLSKTIKTYPAVGWVRASAVASTEILQEVNALRKRNADLEEELRRWRSEQRTSVADLAGLEEEFLVTGSYWAPMGPQRIESDWTARISWATIFGLLAPHLLQPMADSNVRNILGKSIFDTLKKHGTSPEIDDQVYQTVKVQLMAQRLVALKSYKTNAGGTALFWELTEAGKQQMLAVRTVRKTDGAGA